jgi:hypothetical protein
MFPFYEVSDEEFCALSPQNYELALFDNVEMVYYNGYWYPTEAEWEPESDGVPEFDNNGTPAEAEWEPESDWVPEFDNNGTPTYTMTIVDVDYADPSDYAGPLDYVDPWQDMYDTLLIE